MRPNGIDNKENDPITADPMNKADFWLQLL